jgi:glycerol-3-phosphate dehydrogenase (NAD(P)+)
MKPPSIGVLGGGPWGLALAQAATRGPCTTYLYSRRQQDAEVPSVHWTRDLAELARCRLILVAVPSNLARTVARELGEHLDGSHVLVHGIRGLIGPELNTVSQIFREETPVRRLGALGGPVQADELAAGNPSAMVVAAEFPDVTAAVRDALQSDRLQLHMTRDLRGLEWASALVGCLSIGIGYVQARGSVSPGLLAALISRAVDEAATIAVAAGAEEKTFYGLGGYGDLLASMALTDRPEVVLGRELARGAKLEEARLRARLRVEAIDLVPRVAAFARSRGVSCPVLDAIGKILESSSDAEAIVRALFRG